MVVYEQSTHIQNFYKPTSKTSTNTLLEAKTRLLKP